MPASYQKQLAFLKRTAHRAGEVMRRYYGKEFGIYTKPDRSKVTDVDLAISELVQEAVRSSFSDIDLYSEESENPPVDPAASYFIIDELDGTSYLIEGTPGFSHQAAYYDGRSRQLEIGLVYYPIEDILLYAVRGQGAYLEQNGIAQLLPIRSGTPALETLRFAHPARYRGNRYWDLYEALGITEGQVVMVTALRTLQLARQELDVMLFLKPSIPFWDLSGEKVIVEELGFHHGYLNGAPVRFGEAPPPGNAGYLICPETISVPLRQLILEQAAQ